MAETKYYKHPRVVVVENVNGSNVAFLPKKHGPASRVLKLNGVAIEILKLLETQMTAQEIISVISERYPDKTEAIAKDVRAYLAHLLANKFIKESSDDKKRVLLVYPFSRDKELTEAVPPMGLLLLAGILETSGHHARIYDFQLPGSNCKELLQHLEKNPYDVIGFSTNTVNVTDAIMLSAVVRQTFPEIKIIFGGPHATFEYEKLLLNHSQIDMVVLGEAENTIVPGLQFLFADFTGEVPPNVAYVKPGGVVRGPENSVPVDLDSLPLLDLTRVVNFTSVHDYPAYPILTSRGCPFNCAYCASPAFWGRKYRTRSIDKVMEEIRGAKAKYGHKVFKMEDDTITANRARLLEFCEKIGPEQVRWVALSRVEALDKEVVEAMHGSGCNAIFMGIESLNENVLASINKSRRGISAGDLEEKVGLCVNTGMRVDLSFIIGLPKETLETAAATLAFCQSVKAKHPDAVTTNFNFISLFPGTELSRRSEELGYRRVNSNRTESLIGPTCDTKEMSESDMWRAFLTNMLAYSEIKNGNK